MVLYVLSQAIEANVRFGKRFFFCDGAAAVGKRNLKICDFLHTPAGRLAFEWEEACVARVVEDSFGYRALQVGIPQIDFLAANRIASHVCTVSGEKIPAYPGLQQRGFVYARPFELPFASESMDLIVLPHALELSGSVERARRTLKEAARVLVPQGRLVITAFNPLSLWGLRQRLSGIGLGGPYLPSGSSLVTLARLRDWFGLLGLDIDRGAFGCYEPPCRSASAMHSWRWMDKAGDRWWPSLGGVMMLSAVKVLEGMRLIGRVSFSDRKITVAGRRFAAQAGARREAGR